MRRFALFACVCILACEGPPPDPVEAEPGAPLPGLTEAQFETFAAGQALFNRPFTPEEGLGPTFNQTRCSSCHDLPSSGGHGAEPVTKATRFDEVAGCSVLADEGGDLLQASVTPALREAGIAAELIPPSATAVTEVRPPPLYGLGLVAAVPEEDIRSRADPQDRDGDGISGRVGQGPAGALGRLGAKGQHATIEGFIEEALLGELGLTTPARPNEEAPNGQPLPEDLDPAPDPEIEQAQVTLLADYVRFLAAPRGRPIEAGTERDVRAGERIFDEIGCAACHTPTLTTGPHEIAALDRKRFPVYSDLLLHDMGEDLADICSPGAAPGEWLTTRLTGLGYRTQFLHNRRAQGLEEAIQLHGGEGSASRDAYEALGPAERAWLMTFLRSL